MEIDFGSARWRGKGGIMGTYQPTVDRCIIASA